MRKGVADTQFFPLHSWQQPEQPSSGVSTPAPATARSPSRGMVCPDGARACTTAASRNLEGEGDRVVPRVQ